MSAFVKYLLPPAAYDAIRVRYCAYEGLGASTDTRGMVSRGLVVLPILRVRSPLPARELALGA